MFFKKNINEYNIYSQLPTTPLYLTEHSVFNHIIKSKYTIYDKEYEQYYDFIHEIKLPILNCKKLFSVTTSNGNSYTYVSKFVNTLTIPSFITAFRVRYAIDGKVYVRYSNKNFNIDTRILYEIITNNKIIIEQDVEIMEIEACHTEILNNSLNIFNNLFNDYNTKFDEWYSEQVRMELYGKIRLQYFA